MKYEVIVPDAHMKDEGGLSRWIIRKCFLIAFIVVDSTATALFGKVYRTIVHDDLSSKQGSLSTFRIVLIKDTWNYFLECKYL